MCELNLQIELYEVKPDAETDKQFKIPTQLVAFKTLDHDASEQAR